MILWSEQINYFLVVKTHMAFDKTKGGHFPSTLKVMVSLTKNPSASDLRVKFHLNESISCWMPPNKVVLISFPLPRASLVLVQPLIEPTQHAEEVERWCSLCEESTQHMQLRMRSRDGNVIPSMAHSCYILWSITAYSITMLIRSCWCWSRNRLSNKDTKLIQTFDKFMLEIDAIR